MIVPIILLGASTVGAQNSHFYVYPSKGQSQAQQDKDRYECHQWAVKQTGFDPTKPQAGSPTVPSQDFVRPNRTLPGVLVAAPPLERLAVR